MPKAGPLVLLHEHHSAFSFEISMSVLLLLTSWCSLVTAISSEQSFDLRRLNEASSLLSYRVTQSNSLVEAIVSEFSRY